MKLILILALIVLTFPNKIGRVDTIKPEPKQSHIIGRFWIYPSEPVYQVRDEHKIFEN